MEYAISLFVQRVPIDICPKHYSPLAKLLVSLHNLMIRTISGDITYVTEHGEVEQVPN